MTERLYYSDSYTRRFAARVRESTTVNEQPALVLDQTFFYPASGGQPGDRGAMGGVPVVEVVVRESDNAILHIVEQAIQPAPQIECEIDWPRRFDHMQQHTGQHILSQAFIRAAEALTVGFHLGAETVTIDLDADKLPLATLERAEQIANEAVIANHPIRAWFPTPDELAQLVLRKTPDVDGPLRVVAIGDFDYNACGGTHVAHSGEVGSIKILKVEKQKKGARVEFICGGRALGDYARKHAIVTQLANDFTCGQAEVPDAVARLRGENQSLRKELRVARDELLDYEAARLAEAAPTRNGIKVVRGAWPDRDMNDLRGIATRVTASGGAAALLASAGDKANVVFARSGDLDRDMNQLLKSALSQLNGARGGGSPSMAQGGGVSASVAEIEKILKFAEAELLK
ncbi:MAG TPA: DHHA1 domain-containing protein [Anaerolineales bacterium]|nr:DHHA1 domain-containing protein [Anaerolineales bacterium]